MPLISKIIQYFIRTDKIVNTFTIKGKVQNLHVIKLKYL